MTALEALFVGRATLDVLYRLDRLPDENTKLFASAFSAAPGGPALNAAITHARLGGQAHLAAAVGQGPWAAPLRAELDRLAVHLFDLAQGTDYQTPLATAWIHSANGSRTVVNPPAWSGPPPRLAAQWPLALSSGALQSALWDSLPPVVLSDGFHLPETLDFFAACHARGAALCLDGGSWKPLTEKLAPLLRVAICSERFAVPGLPHSPEATLDWFAALGVPYVAITRGERPILALDHGRRFQIEIEPIAAVDTLGAGDVLHGAFCFHFAQRPEFEPALRRAARLATRSCLGIGTDAWSERP